MDIFDPRSSFPMFFMQKVIKYPYGRKEQKDH